MSDMEEFETEHLYLRGVTHQDIPAYERYFVDYDVISQLSAKKAPQNKSVIFHPIFGPPLNDLGTAKSSN